MAILNKEKLFEKIEEAIKDCGWQIKSKSDVQQLPIRCEIANEIEHIKLIIYIWNLSHGGGQRSTNEFRIQVKVSKFEIEEDNKTLILGWWDEESIFAGFDVNKHLGKPGWSASLQIKKDTLNKAKANKVASSIKENKEVAIAFTPEFLIDYIKNIEQIHSNGNIDSFKTSNTDTENNEETIIEDDTTEEIASIRYQITSYGADYPVDTIVRRIKEDVIFVPPFQRKFVWNQVQASKFIESLILGLPVPGIFLSKEEGDTGKLLIIDGQQRLFSLFSFYENNFKGNVFKLKGVQDDLINKTYNDLNPDDKRTLDDAIIHATIIKQDDPDDGESSVYLIFERLNTTSKQLSPQEIRACIYYGKFNELLNKLINDTNWRNIFGKVDERLKEQELILRFFALYCQHENYVRPLKIFLNDFMYHNRNFEIFSEEELIKIFSETITFINTALNKKAFRIGKGVNAALFDAIMVGIANRFKNKNINDTDSFILKYNQLLENSDFIQSIKESTANEINVKKRIDLAIKQFENLD